MPHHLCRAGRWRLKDTLFFRDGLRFVPFRPVMLIAGAALALLAYPVAAGAAPKAVIATASQLPPLTIALRAKPSVLVAEGGPGYQEVSRAVSDYAKNILDNYEVRDRATERQLLSLLLQTAMAENHWADALSYSRRIEALEDKPSEKATTGLLSRAYARAAMAVGQDSAQFADRFQQEFEKSLRAVDLTLGRDKLQAMLSQFQVSNKDLLLGSLQGSVDANAEAQRLQVGLAIAATIVAARQTLTELLPLRERIVAALDRRLKSEPGVKEDRWSHRLVILGASEVKKPVTVAVWDGGLDPRVFGKRMWRNPRETLNGKDDDRNGFVDDVNGIAFDADWRPSTGMLRPMPRELVTALGQKLKLVKGSLDLEAGVNSPEADAFRATMAGLKPEQVTPFLLDAAALGLYLHGTATGYISVVGNPAARILGARFDFKISAVPDPIDEKAAVAIGAHARQAVDYFKKNGVRVVNMSWRITEPQIEATLASIEPDPTRRKERARAVFNVARSALEEAFRNAPNILFVAGAGNEDEDVDFVRSFPAGINLPNVITVGAVDSALQPAAFTSYGRSIDVYANGFEVPSKIPGGGDINISGTSLAAPQVTNLAAKLWAVKPSLTVAGVRQLIESTATPEGPKGLKVIDPKAALAKAAQR